MREIMFKGKKYLFGGNSLYDEGFIAKKSDYKNGKTSFAHYYPTGEGVISRYSTQIGTRKDIILGKKIDVLPKSTAFFNLLEWFFYE